MTVLSDVLETFATILADGAEDGVVVDGFKVGDLVGDNVGKFGNCPTDG